MAVAGGVVEMASANTSHGKALANLGRWVRRDKGNSDACGVGYLRWGRGKNGITIALNSEVGHRYS